MNLSNGNRISFFEPHGVPAYVNRPSRGRNPFIMVGLQRELAPPFVYGQNLLQRMRVFVVGPEEAADFDLDDGDDDDSTELLPMFRPPPPSPAQRSLRVRLVHGEILRDDQGNYYERIADRIRPLQRLASGPRGEIVDINPVVEARPPGESAPGDPAPINVRATEPERNIEGRGDKASAPRDKTPVDPAGAALPAWQKLLPEPGPWRVVAFGEFKGMLAPQLAHPERLRDSHRLACYVQAIAVLKPQPIEALALAVFGAGEKVNQLGRLNETLAARLQLRELMAPAPGLMPPVQRMPGVVQPPDRLFHLRLAVDPTVSEPADANRPGNPQPGSGEFPCAEPGAERTPGTQLPSGLKSAIPERYQKPWEFKISREEASYDMKQTSAWSGRFAAFVGRHWNRGDFRRWQTLIHGKCLDDQLWGVRPPKGALEDPVLRDWARQTLELAGYDADAMLREWEVFWRRKGLSRFYAV